MILKSLMITLVLLFSCNTSIIDTENPDNRSHMCDPVDLPNAVNCYWNASSHSSATLNSRKFTGITINGKRYSPNNQIETILTDSLDSSASEEIAKFMLKISRREKLKAEGAIFSSNFFINVVDRPTSTWELGYKGIESDSISIEYHYIPDNHPTLEYTLSLFRRTPCAGSYGAPFPNYFETCK